ncbi:MAG: SusC/RagA family protein, partial [Muribaculaceae bacterium]|nr:SusC/RagA family protein [Muribaculaceae bacterium]
MVINSDFERFGARVNLDGRNRRFKYGLSMNPSYSLTNFVDAESQYNHDGVVANALMCAPVFPVYNADGSYCWDMNGYLRTNLWDTQTTEVLNPVALAKEVTDLRKKFNFIGNVYVTYELTHGLEYKMMFGGDVYTSHRNYYRPSYIQSRGYGNFGVLTAPKATSNDHNYYHWVFLNQLNYNAMFGPHRINAVAVHEAEKQTVTTSVLTGKGTPGDDKVRTTKGVVIDQANSYDDRYAYTFESWLLRASYSYEGRYMLSASIRGDGSSRFAPNTRWGYFPAVSMGWRMSEEPFMRNLTWLNNLKLRISIGQTGNAQIGNFEYMGTYVSGLIDLGSGEAPCYYPKRVAND